MNIIHILLMVGIWYVTIVKWEAYLNMRDDFIKSGASEQPKALKDTQRAFISSAVTAVIYTIIKLA